MIWRLNVFLCLSFLALITTLAATTRPQKLRTRLIHHDSVYSPYYNSTATTADRFGLAIRKSMKRLAYLQARASSFAASADDVRAGLDADGVQFMANISIGQPPVPQLLTIDTGSDLLWVQCLPCTKCFGQSTPTFDPSKSSTYVNLPCSSPSCFASPGHACSSLDNICKFFQGYVDGTQVAGNMGTEKLTFQTSDEGETTVDDVVFGCAHNNVGDSGEPSGLLGLGSDSISLVTKLGGKFSYCLGSIRDPNYSFNQLILGDNAIIEGSSTPIELFDSLYYVTLEGISLGESMIKIDPQVFKRTPSGTGGVMIDSGSTFTYLAIDAYNSLSDQVKSLLDETMERVVYDNDPKILCYKGDIDRDLIGFPVVTFHFSGGAELGLDVGSLFDESNEGDFCMVVRETDLNGLSVIGTMAQQSYNVAFDLIGKTVSFQRIDCQLLES